jgi:hypothetical protein
VKESLDLLQNDMLHLKEHLLRIELRMQLFLRGNLRQVQKESLMQRCHQKEEDHL